MTESYVAATKKNNEYKATIKRINADKADLKNTMSIQRREIDTLENYEIIKKFIQETCLEITGQEHNPLRGIYNNIYSLVKLKCADTILQANFGMTPFEFKGLVINSKKKRTLIAHPSVENTEIEDVQRAVSAMKRILEKDQTD